ncbi:solute carrier family 23 member 1 [Trichonephila clavipes]|nr:solute carrier family 23 member 1 [Trichonephila clavipes]
MCDLGLKFLTWVGVEILWNYSRLKKLDYDPNSRHLREILIFCFNMKKSAAEAHRMLSNTYGEAAISKRTCREWFQRFKNGDFDVEDQHFHLVGPARRSVL